MSLISELLSKIKKTSTTKADVPPNLAKELEESSRESTNKKRTIRLLIVAVLCAVLGFLAIYVVEILVGTQPNLRPPKQIAMQNQHSATQPSAQLQTPQAPPPQQPLAPQSTAKAKAHDTEPPAEATPKRQAVSRQIKHPQPAQKQKLAKANIAIEPTQAPKTFENQSETSAKSQPPSQRVLSPDLQAKIDQQLYLARTYEAQRNYQMAFNAYKNIAELAPDNYLVLNNLAGLAIHLGLYDDAVAYGNKALQINPKHIGSFINLAIALGKQNKNSEAEGYLLQALSLEPRNQTVLQNLGLLYERQNVLNKALQFYERLYDTGSVNGALGLARVYEKQGQNDSAIRLYNELLLNPNLDAQAKKTANERLNILLRYQGGGS